MNPTKDLKYIANKFLQNWSNSRKFVKCPNALKTQSTCGENFLGEIFFFFEKLENFFREKGKLQQQNIPNDFTFWHDQDEKKLKNQK